MEEAEETRNTEDGVGGMSERAEEVGGRQAGHKDNLAALEREEAGAEWVRSTPPLLEIQCSRRHSRRRTCRRFR
jgi:hypothetical protein